MDHDEPRYTLGQEHKALSHMPFASCIHTCITRACILKCSKRLEAHAYTYTYEVLKAHTHVCAHSRILLCSSFEVCESVLVQCLQTMPPHARARGDSEDDYSDTDFVSDFGSENDCGDSGFGSDSNSDAGSDDSGFESCDDAGSDSNSDAGSDADSDGSVASDELTESDSEGSGDNMSKEEAGDEFVGMLIEMLLLSEISALRFCNLCFFAAKAGMRGPAKVYGSAPGKQTGQYQRKLNRLLGHIDHEKTLKRLTVMGQWKYDLSRQPHNVYVNPLHEALAAEIENDPTLITTKLEDRLRARDFDHERYESHPVTQSDGPQCCHYLFSSTESHTPKLTALSGYGGIMKCRICDTSSLS